MVSLKHWVAALRSGDYKQTQGALRRVENYGSTSYCCLGVYCDLAGKKVNQTRGNTDIYEWLELTIGKHFSIGKVAAMNDGGLSFDEIADWLEKEWKP
jgi:hypothetical protein